MGIRAIFYVAGRNFMENDMSKTHEYFQQELGLDKKTLKAHPKLSQPDSRV